MTGGSDWEEMTGGSERSPWGSRHGENPGWTGSYDQSMRSSHGKMGFFQFSWALKSMKI